jgi:mannose-6-phosphate isomerase-like protein (cupin superfamily)
MRQKQICCCDVGILQCGLGVSNTGQGRWRLIETIAVQEKTLAIIIRASFRCEGIRFFTPNDFSQQLAYMNRPAGYVIAPHVHNPVKREVHYTKEVLFVRSGRVRVDFYDDLQNYLRSTILSAGDVILLAFGGHGFEMLEPTEIIEVKQGPYAGEGDKLRFSPVDTAGLKWHNG